MPAKTISKFGHLLSAAANYLTKLSIETNCVDPDLGLIMVYTLFAEEASATTSKSFRQIAK